MRDLRSRRRLLALGAATIVLVLACSCELLVNDSPSSEGSTAGEARARAIVTTFLTQLTTDTADRGWSLLHPTTQQSMFQGDLDTYLDLARTGEGRNFTWRVDHVEMDDPQLYRVFLTLPAGSALPPILTTPRNHLFIMGQSGSVAEIPVRFGLGGDGIWAIGG
jgi:predicted dithiol-disulfide oxidoreductase (DUF899 family)